MEIKKTTITHLISFDGPDIDGSIVVINNVITEVEIRSLHNGKRTITHLNSGQIESLCKEFGEVLNFVQTQNKINNEQTNRNVSRDAEIS